MPKEFDKCVEALIGQGKDKDSAYAICTAQFKEKHGMTPAEAAKKQAEDEIVELYERSFQMPDKFLYTIAPQTFQFEEEKEFSDESKNIRIQMLKLGTFEHPEYGKLDFNEKMFDAFIENFENKVPQEQIAFDYKHRPDWGAAAWVKRVFKENDGLWAEVELTRRGFDSLKNKEFIYFSTEYVDNYIDRANGKKYGPAILGGGLTNRPFIKGMAPAMLSEEGEIVLSPAGDTQENHSSKEEEEKMLNEILTKLKELQDQLAAMQEKDDDEKSQEFAEALGNQITALSEKAEELKKLTDENPQVKELEDQNKKLTEEVSTLTETTKRLLEQREADSRRLYEQDVDAFCKEMEGAGFWPGTMKEVKDILLSANTRDSVVTLSEEVEGQEEPKKVDIDLRGVIQRVLNSIPEESRVDLEEKTHGKATERNPETKLMSDEDVQKYADEKKLSFKDALIELSKAGKLTM